MVKGLQDQIAQQQADMNSLQMQLVEARRALVAEKQGRDMLAQDMKRSFMRGVCALNLEAMQVNTHLTPTAQGRTIRICILPETAFLPDCCCHRHYLFHTLAMPVTLTT